MTVCPDCGTVSGDPEPHPHYALCPACSQAMRDRANWLCEDRQLWQARMVLSAVIQHPRFKYSHDGATPAV